MAWVTLGGCNGRYRGSRLPTGRQADAADGDALLREGAFLVARGRLYQEEATGSKLFIERLLARRGSRQPTRACLAQARPPSATVPVQVKPRAPARRRRLTTVLYLGLAIALPRGAIKPPPRWGRLRAGLARAPPDSRRSTLAELIVIHLLHARRALKSLRIMISLAVGLQVVLPTTAAPTLASSVTSMTIGGTTNIGGTQYAKSGTALTLSVTTSADTKCVDVPSSFAGNKVSDSGQSSWTFTGMAGTGEGPQTVIVTAYANKNCNGSGGGQSGSASTVYVLDNAGPSLTALLSPTPNMAGWNKANVNIAWTATDSGSGVASGPNPTTDNVTAETAGATKSASASDRLGNSSTSSVTVKLDKTAPSITPSTNPAANANGWNNTDVVVSFTCDDTLSGTKSCSNATTTLSSESANQAVTGTAVDNADNSASSTATVKIDKTRPVLSGAPTTSPNANGWYSANVAVHWTALDGLSGIDPATQPSDTSLTGEGQGLTATASVSDKAGNTTTATSGPAVNIDKTAPNTTATAPANWNNTDVTVTLAPFDSLSGVATTHFILDGGAPQAGTTVVIGTEGVHSLAYWSVDKAGNSETPKTVQVKIDRTPPTINHAQLPTPNANGWNNTNVTLTFQCADLLSPIVDCTLPQTVATEGKDQTITGTARDAAGNTASDPATVSIDKRAPTISALPDRLPNTNGWYRADVTVNFTCADALSGIDICPAAKTLGEGADQSVSGIATDGAGNSATAALGGLSVDKTAPLLVGAPTTAPNAAGWYRGDVTIGWTAVDALSGIAGATPADSTISGEGEDLSASASVTDRAANSTTATVRGVNIDRIAPTTQIDIASPLASGWYAAAPTIALNGVDSLSGVAATFYAVDGETPQTFGGQFVFAQGGTHTLTFWSTDRAGNVENVAAPGHSITLKIDNIAPVISGSRTTPPNAFGWNNGSVSVAFACDDAESGIATCTHLLSLTTEGANQDALGQAIDNAGNINSALVGDINIDLTAPTLSGSATTQANSAGWYKADVTIHWTGVDSLSGIDPASQPQDSLIDGEGANLGAGPVTIADKAGNQSLPASVIGLKIDRTAPITLADGPSTWINTAATVKLAPADALSGVAGTYYALDSGAQQTGTSISVATEGSHGIRYWSVDQAGNTETPQSFTVQIDKTVPQAKASITCQGIEFGYCQGLNAPVALSATDDASGVRAIHYVLAGRDEVVEPGDAAAVTVPLSDADAAKLSYWAVDNAGNASEPQMLALKGDDVAPTITANVNPAANADGWNKTAVSVKFEAEDNQGGSGVASVNGDQTLISETAGTDVVGSASDRVGNTANKTVTVRIDQTPPAIAGAATAEPNENGWYQGKVTVHFTCVDRLSDVATCSDDVVLTDDGTNLSVAGTAADKAGNTASATLSGINIDTVKPVVQVGGVATGAVYIRGSVPHATCTATDDRSGIDGECTLAVSGASASGTGQITVTASAKDKAGNLSDPAAITYTVYAFDFGGWQQPLASPIQTFKAGSTIPVKIQLLANGKSVQAQVSPKLAYSTDGVRFVPATSAGGANVGDAFRWDSAAQQYVFNLKTTGLSAGKLVLKVTLEDGSAVDVTTQLTLK